MTGGDEMWILGWIHGIGKPLKSPPKLQSGDRTKCVVEQIKSPSDCYMDIKMLIL